MLRKNIPVLRNVITAKNKWNCSFYKSVGPFHISKKCIMHCLEIGNAEHSPSTNPAEIQVYNYYSALAQLMTDYEKKTLCDNEIDLEGQKILKKGNSPMS